MLAVMLDNGDYVSISLVVVIIAAVVSVLKMNHSAKTEHAKQRQADLATHAKQRQTDREADTARHHSLDKRIDRQEQRAELAPVAEKLTTVLERILERDPRGSGVYPRRPSDGD